MTSHDIDITPPDIICECWLRMVAGGEVCGVLPSVLVSSPGRVVVNHPVPDPGPAAAGQPHTLLGGAVQTSLV